MAGRKQHYIPQCLLRGFEAKRNGRHAQVHVFRVGGNSYLSSTEGVASERDFYSSLSTGDRKTLDDLITDYEQRLSPLLNQLRNVRHKVPVDSLLAAEVVTHLTIRSAFLRNAFDFGVHELLNSVSGFFADAESVRFWAGIDRSRPKQILVEEIDRAVDALRTHFPDPIPDDILRRMLLFRLREEFDFIFQQQITPLGNELAELKAATAELIRNSHAKVLDKDLVPQERAAALAKLHWRIFCCSEENLILPDCVAISVGESGGRPYSSYLLNADDELKQVLLPISASLLLVGTADSCMDVRIDEFNNAAAACSFDFFISSKVTESIDRLASRIGTHSKESLLTTVRETVATLHSTPDYDLNKNDDLSACPIDMTGHQFDGYKETFKYSVSFLDCADEQTAEKVASILKYVVNQIGYVIPLRRLESIIFAEDYAAALHQLDRGFSTTFPLRPTEDGQEIGVAMAPIVVRDGEIRVCVVARAWLAHTLLLQGDEQSVLTSFHTIATMLGRVAFVELFDTALPNTLLRPIQDELQAFLFQYIDESCSTYFSSRIAAEIFPEAAEAYSEVFLTALDALNINVPKARLTYRVNGDIDVFLAVMVPAIGSILVRAAGLLGHFDGLERSLDEAANVTEALKRCDLRSWIDVFHRDLDGNYARQGKWQSLDEFTDLTVHMERLMWKFGVFPWRMDTGGIRVEIPIGTDLAALQELQAINRT